MSKTKIVLEEPFSNDWETGYLNINREGRRMVYLYNSHDKSRTTLSFARYILSCHLNRYLLQSEHVDHKDEDKTNDDIQNLQIISQAENSRKYAKLNGKKMAKIRCPNCHKIFSRRTGNTQAVESLKGKITCCDRKCSVEFQKKKLSIEEKLVISEESLLEIFQEYD